MGKFFRVPKLELISLSFVFKCLFHIFEDLNRIEPAFTIRYNLKYIVLVTGETLRYTARDMEVIRREARIQAEGSNSELEQYKTIVKGMGDLIEHLLSKHQDELSKRVSYIGSCSVGQRVSYQTNIVGRRAESSGG